MLTITTDYQYFSSAGNKSGSQQKVSSDYAIRPDSESRANKALDRISLVVCLIGALLIFIGLPLYKSVDTTSVSYPVSYPFHKTLALAMIQSLNFSCKVGSDTSHNSGEEVFIKVIAHSNKGDVILIDYSDDHLPMYHQ